MNLSEKIIKIRDKEIAKLTGSPCFKDGQLIINTDIVQKIKSETYKRWVVFAKNHWQESIFATKYLIKEKQIDGIFVGLFKDSSNTALIIYEKSKK